MKIDNDLIESLLYEEEGVELDLKRDQYVFINANDDDKSELLKDILAFANSWHRSDAFILIGVQEVKGGRSIVVGINNVLDDAAIQQFINSKTNRPIIFSYKNIEFEGKKIAIINIPVQQRPIYLKKDFGKLKKDSVYLKRGSSTTIADIDEISKMGVQSYREPEKPELKVHFADFIKRTPLSDEQSVKSLVLEIPKESSIPDYCSKRQDSFDIKIYRTNLSYYRKLSSFTRLTRLVLPVYFAIENSGSATAQDVRIEMKIDKLEGDITVIDGYDYPKVPQSESSIMDIPIRSVEKTFELTVNDIGNNWVVEGRVDKVQSKGWYWFRDPFYIGSSQTCKIILEILIFSDELSSPRQQQLTINIESERRKVDLKDILELEAERFKASPEFKRIIQMCKERE